MKVAKIKKQDKNKKVELERSEYSLKNLLIIILILLITFIVFYLITYFVVKNNKTDNTSSEVTEIDSSKIIFSNMLSQSEDEYYVLAYKSKKDNDMVDYKALYDSYLNTYSSRTDSLKVYTIDISDALNKWYVGDKINIGDNLDNLQINDEVLFKIKSSKIEKTYVGNEKILDKLSRL